MTPAFDKVVQQLKRLPGLGFRSAEKLALHLLIEQPGELQPLLDSLDQATQLLSQCKQCGNITEGQDLCSICSNPARNQNLLCIIETIPDLHAMERSGSYQGVYHVLHGKLSPIKGIEPQHLNFASLRTRLESQPIEEIILGLNNDIESEATCHYLSENVLKGLDGHQLKVSRIGFGLPSGAGVLYADSATLSNALMGRRSFE